jgi:hypothetical protein
MNATVNVFQCLFHDFETSYIKQNLKSPYLPEGTANMEVLTDGGNLNEPFCGLLDVDITSCNKLCM